MSLLEQFERYVRDVRAREDGVISNRLDQMKRTLVTSRKLYQPGDNPDVGFDISDPEKYNPWEESGMLAKWQKEQHLEEIKHAGDEYEV